jgi:tetratricopeptide (TPR) repeat protein
MPGLPCWSCFRPLCCSLPHQKCLACHGNHFAAKHHRTQLDCTRCHMPGVSSTDVAHTQVTDHRIPRRAEASAEVLAEVNPVPTTPRLLPFPDSPAAEQDLRDLALAWQALATNDGVESAEPHAESLLRNAVTDFPNHPDLLSALAYVEQKHGLTAQASELYRRALAVNPDLIDAATDLGVIEAESGPGSCGALATGIPTRTRSKQFRHESGRRILRREAVRRSA